LDQTNTLRVPDVTLFDAMIAYETEHWRWQITGKNLEDKEYLTTCLARGDCFIGTARTIVTGLTYKY
jgi:iron complex outermembrane recepter protein